MRTWTAAEEHAYDTTEPRILTKVEIRDSGGTLRDWCDIDGNGTCLIESITWGDNLDQPMASGQARIMWQRTAYDGVSPFVSGGRWAGYIAEWREIVISTKVIPPLAVASTFSWVEVFRGRVDSYDLSGLPGTIEFRDKIGAELMDQQMAANRRQGDDAGTLDLEDVMQDVLDADDATGVVLEVPVASSFQVRAYNQQKMRILQALRNLAFTLGWDVRSKWKAADSAFKLTLYEPDRTASVPDYTIDPAHIRQWSQFGSTVENIRNAVRVWYGDGSSDDDLGNPTRTSVIRTSTTSPAHDLAGTPVANSSIDQYGWRLMELAEASTSIIQTQADAEALADAALSDLATPTLIARCVLGTYFWPVELNDFYQIVADGIRLGADTDVAIFGYTHAIGPDGARTELDLRAKPGLGPAAYFSRDGEIIALPDDLAPPAPTLTLSSGAFGVRITATMPRDLDWDRVLFYRGDASDFTADADSLVQAGRQTDYLDDSPPTTTVYFKAKFRDIHGNYSALATLPLYAIPLVPITYIIPAPLLDAFYTIPLADLLDYTLGELLTGVDGITTLGAPTSIEVTPLAITVTATTAWSGPTIRDSTTDTATSTDTYTCPLPASITAGDLLLVFAMVRGNDGAPSGWLTPSGWTREVDSYDLDDRRWYVYSKVADGTETNVTFLSGSSGNASVIATASYSVQNAGDVYVSSTGYTALDPPSFSPSPGSDEYLWFGFSGDDGWTALTVPTDYENLSAVAAYDSGTAEQCRIGVASRELETATEDPGAFGGTAVGTYRAWTVAVGPPGLWTPAELPDLFAWWDPADAAVVTVDGSGYITDIADKSGNGYDLSAVGTGCNQVTINGIGAAQTNGYGQYLTATDDPSSVTHMYAVADSNSDTLYFVACGQSTSTYIGPAQSGSLAPTGAVAFGVDGGAAATTDRNGLYTLLDGQHIVAAEGMSIGTWTQFNPFYFPQASWQYAGSFGDVILLTAAPSTGDRQKIEGYLAWKYGLEGNLDAGHPYKSAPP